MSRMRLVGTVLMALAACGGSAGAETISDAWRMARESNASFAAAQSESSAADASSAAAARQRWPVLRLTGSYAKLDQSPLLDIQTPAGEFRSPKIWRNDTLGLGSAEVSMPLFTAGRLSGSIAAARGESRAAAAQVRRAAADLELAVVETYLGVLRSRRALEVADSSFASLEAHAAAVRVMYEKEAVPRTDLLAAEVALANARQLQIRAANAVRIATAAYNRQVGQPLDRIPDLEEPRDEAATGSAADVAALTAQALGRRPELEALSESGAALERGAQAERALYWPQVALRAGYQHFDNQILDRQNVGMVGIGFEWRLFDSGQTAARAAALRHRARAAAHELEDARSAIALEVESAALALEEARARVRAASTAVDQAEENLRSARELYASGLGTNTLVLDAESLRVGALTNRDNALYDVQLARYQLRHASAGS
ncbi:MAG: TolC family protein [Proteobacteria bacterium]|nr:TolC family protein [Pseudomonadota bacterium]